MTPQAFLELLSSDLMGFGQGLAVNLPPTKQGGMPAFGWLPGKEVRQDMTHFSGGVFAVMANGTDRMLSRTLDMAEGVIAIIADDIGVKGDGIPGLTPWAKIQTRAGSEQWVYAVAGELMSVADARACYTALRYGGWSDPQGNNPVRVARLPGSQPPDKPEPAKILEISGVRYHPFDLTVAIWAALDPIQEKVALERLNKVAGVWEGDPDPLLEWFRDNSMLLHGPDKEGWCKILCPSFMDHTDHDMGGTSYHVGINYQTRAWMCRHATCRNTNRKSEWMVWAKKQGAPIEESYAMLKKHRTHRSLPHETQ